MPGPGCCAGHEVVLDTQHAELYCTRCADYVYDKEFDMVKLVRGVPPTELA